MHHFIYPSQDTFITNTLGLESLNFGLDEILRVGTQNVTSKILYPTTIINIGESGSFVTNLCVDGFSGSLSTSSFYGSASYISGNILNISNESPVIFTIDYFSGSIMGNLSGWITNSLFITSSFTGSIDGFSGSVDVSSGSVNGIVSGSITSNYFSVFDGIIIGFTGKILSGNINGVSVSNVPYTSISTNLYENRSLVQFNIDSISSSIENGDITNPTFKLKLKVAREGNLPIMYNVYAFPIFESWVMGDGYVSDGGSTEGASWIYRDEQNGTPWIATGSSYIQTMSVTQSFNYQIGDINMDVTPIVMAWISGTFDNNGFVLICSDDISQTGSGMELNFFSKDTNTIYEPILDVGWGNDYYWSTGSVITKSINIGEIPPGLLGVVSDSASISGSLYGGFTGFANIYASSSISYSYDTSSMITSSVSSTNANGVMSVTGVNGLIISMSIVGNFSGSISSSIVTLISKCQTCHPRAFPYYNDTDFSPPFYPSAGDDEAFNVIDGQFPSQYYPYPNVPGWIEAGLSYLKGGQNQTQYQGHDIYGWGHGFDEFNQYDWTSDHVYQNEFGPDSIKLCKHGYNCGPYQVTMSYLMGTLLDGTLPGATFTSSLINNYILGYGNLIGSWNESLIDGTYISASYPLLPLYPSALFVSFYGNYVSGSAFGSITDLSASYGVFNYGIFDGVFTSGPLTGIQIHAPFTGSILSSSYFFTSSLNLISHSLSPVDIQKPFTTVVQNIPSTVKSGNIIKINVFARSEFPLKNFDRQTQFTQFLIPQYLPSGSSYYSIKDNETEEVILDFDEYTKLSCDQNGNYFLLDTAGFPQERYFKILIKVEQSGSVYTMDKNNIFKIVR